MQLKHSFDIPLPLPKAWDTVLNLEDVAPCLPGATATKTGEASYDVAMKVRLGPLDLLFKGGIELIDVQRELARFACKAKVQESKGQGSATGTTVVQLTEIPGGTRVDLGTELMIAGRVAQMGRGFVGEVSNDLLGQFSANLERHLSSRKSQADPGTAPVAGEAPGLGQGARPASGAATAPVAPHLNVWSMLLRVLRRRLASAWRGKQP